MPFMSYQYDENTAIFQCGPASLKKQGLRASKLKVEHPILVNIVKRALRQGFQCLGPLRFYPTVFTHIRRVLKFKKKS